VIDNVYIVTTTYKPGTVPDVTQLKADTMDSAIDHIERRARAYSNQGYHVTVTRQGKLLVAKCGDTTIEIGVGK